MVYEILYAYLYKKNYLGNCSCGKQIYTLTKGMSEIKINEISRLISDVDKAATDKIDAKYGVKISDSKVNPDFNLVSYAYFPSLDEYDTKAVCRYGLRKSLKNAENLRGTKELLHAVFTDEETVKGACGDEVYMVDLINLKELKDNDDIEYSQEEGEKKPEELEPVNLTDCISQQITGDAVISNRREIAETLNAFLKAKEDKKPLYIVYSSPADAYRVLNLIKAVLKLFPARVANTISFITACGSASHAGFDICGIPTCDDEYIKELKQSGVVIIKTPGGCIGIGGEKKAFAEFIARADENAVRAWFDSEKGTYYPVVTTIKETEDAIALFRNKEEVKETDTLQAAKNFEACVQLVLRNAGMIDRIYREGISQIRSLKIRLENLCAEIRNLRVNTIHDKIFVPLLKLYKAYAGRTDDEEREIKDMLPMVLIGMEGQSRESAKRHYDLLFYNENRVLEELEEAGLDFVAMLEKYRKDSGEFVADFLNGMYDSEELAERSDLFAKDMLKKLVGDITDGKYAYLRDYFLMRYLVHNPSKFKEILKRIFSGSDKNDALVFVNERLLASTGNEELDNDRIRQFCDFVKENGLLENATLFFRNEFIGATGNDDTTQKVLRKLVENYVLNGTDLKNVTIAGLCDKRDAVEKIIGEYRSISFKSLIYDILAKTLINPTYKEVIKNVNFAEIKPEDVKRCEDLAYVYGNNGYTTSIDSRFIYDVGEMLKKYEKYREQEAKVKELTDFRVKFIVRELLLLDGKTIVRLLTAATGKDYVRNAFKKEGIENIQASYKDEKLVKAAGKVATAYLLYDDSNLRPEELKRLRENQLQFVSAIKAEKKKRNELSRFRRLTDVMAGGIASTLFSLIAAAVVGVISFLLYKYFAGEYFRTIYIVFPIATLGIAQITYWSNFRERRLRSPLITASWQTAVIMIATIGIYVLAQYVLNLI